MKRIVAIVLGLALSATALAQLPTVPWRSPVTPAPGLAGFSRLDAERHQRVMEQELAAWRARKPRFALTGR